MRFLTTSPSAASEASSSPNAPARAHQLAFAALVCVVLGGAILYLDGLTVAPIKDEEQFWAQTLAFADSWPPSLEQLRTYQEPMPPIAFLAWGGLESWLQLGIAATRLVSLLASLVVLAMIALRHPVSDAGRAVPVLSALALFAYPYWIPMSVLMYTDMLAVLFGVLGFALYLRDRHGASALLFALAIGTRQYSVTFPAAIFAHEALAMLRARAPAWSRSLPYLASTATLLGWFTFFGGLGPAPALEKWPRHTIALSNIEPSFVLYYLASLGAYYVALEFALDRRWRSFAQRIDRRSGLSIAAVALLFLVFTPDYPGEVGPLNRAISFVLGSSPLAGAIHMALLFALACASVLRFARLDFGGVIVIVNAGLMPFLWSPWEKYCMPVLASLWFLKAAGVLDAVPAGSREADGAATAAASASRV